ncbi:unnamed protein product [Paramecium primaurelia]|uniref:Uncharacterized protein n=1 Tax=Paramecium primaurelia TaxID=5886 RepID=A0A8S1PQD1_PARPR|nr:unnamed protein product [Paramecium primaurelia]
MGITCSQPKNSTLTLTISQENQDPNYEIKKLLNQERITKLRKTFPSPTQTYESYFLSQINNDKTININRCCDEEKFHKSSKLGVSLVY